MKVFHCLQKYRIVITLHKDFEMKKWLLIVLFVFSFSLFTIHFSLAQCSICTRTAQQQGERPAKALNAGILYLAFMPLAIVGVIGYRWWKSNKEA
jgi:hypothetical protein